MDRQKTILTGIAVIVFATLLASPAIAHRKYRPYHKSMTRRVWVVHSHEASEPAEPAAPTQVKTKDFDLLGGAADIVNWAVKTFDNAVQAVFGVKAEPASHTQRIESHKSSSQYRNYSFARKHKHLRSMPR